MSKYNYRKFTTRRRFLRQRQTETEEMLWEEVRRKTLRYKFRRQHSIGSYIVDFCCLEKKLVIEVDGPYHDLPEDTAKTTYLQSQGYKVLRFTTEQITNGLPDVLATIKQCLDGPSPMLGEGRRELGERGERR